MKLIAVLLLLLLAAGAVGAEPKRVLVMGDSMLAAHINTERSVGHIIERELGAEVRNMPVLAARIIYRLPLTGALGLNIGQQYRKGDWDYIVINGGGNDLWLGCGCERCDRRMTQLIREDGRAGEIPELAQRLTQTGAEVLWVGYLRSPGFGSPIEHCKDEGIELETRLKRLARAMPNFRYISNADLVPPGDKSYHTWDHIHPSPKGTAEIAKRVLRHMRQSP